jgi:hypothetical protein
VQLDILVKYCNRIPVFTRNVERCDLENILFCTHPEHLQVTVNKYIACLFNKLKEEDLICCTWMSVAQRHNCFISKKDNPVTSKDLSAALSQSSKIKRGVTDAICDCIDSILSIED